MGNEFSHVVGRRFPGPFQDRLTSMQSLPLQGADVVKHLHKNNNPVFARIEPQDAVPPVTQKGLPVPRL